MTPTNDITLLLEKYFSGITSGEEEALLQAYFASDQVKDAHKPYIPLFGYILDAKQNAHIQCEMLPQRASNKKWLYIVSSAAASILLFWGISNYRNRIDTPLIEEQKSFVRINGVYSDDPELVHYYAAQAINSFLIAEKTGFEESLNTARNVYQAIDDCLATFDINTYN